MTTDPDSPTVVYRAATNIEAAPIVAALEAEGIEATVTGTFTSGFQAEAPGDVQVVVRQSQAEKASELIAKWEAE
ncbi:MAG: hypothetical protein CMJ64_13370 [Planctomycetaceae bacterium]|nr:hypothetical protein [Planctomycetaceae bacterium]